MLLHTDSLADTVDAVNEALFNGDEITYNDRLAVSMWIASRQGMKGSYGNMFAPTDWDYRDGFRLFTSEKVTSGAGTGHILGEEACRILVVLDVDDAGVKTALGNATEWLIKRLKLSYEERAYEFGMFCCGTCSVSLWRHIAAGGLDDQENRLTAGIGQLKRYRTEKGKYRRFPFWYTLLALSEMDISIAHTEIEYVAPVLERYVKRNPKDKYGIRKKRFAEKALNLI